MPPMRPSHRIETLTAGGSDSWDITRKTRAMKAQGIEITDLTIGEHDRPTGRDTLATFPQRPIETAA